MPFNRRSFQSLDITLHPGEWLPPRVRGPGQSSVNYSARTPITSPSTTQRQYRRGQRGKHTAVFPAGSGQTGFRGRRISTAWCLARRHGGIQGSESTFAPEYGRAPGGQVSIITRSGTNQFHGDCSIISAITCWTPMTGSVNARAARIRPKGKTIWRRRLCADYQEYAVRLRIVRRSTSDRAAQVNAYVPSACARGEATCPPGVRPRPRRSFPISTRFLSRQPADARES